MRIGMVSATFDADVVNGVVRMVDLYRKHLEARGHQVTIFALGEEEAIDVAAGIVRSPGLPLGDFGYYAGIGYTPEAQRLLAQMDIVHCHHLFMSLELAHRYARAPIVYTNHTRYDLYTVSYTHVPTPVADAIMRYAWPHFTDMADHVIAPSAGIQHVMAEFGVRTPTSVIENGIELDQLFTPPDPLNKAELGLPNDSILVIYCGRLSAEKDVEHLLQLFAGAARQRDDLFLMLIGQGPLEDQLRRMTEGYNLVDRVRFLGAIPFGAVGNYLAAGDLFATASTSEVHPLTVIEAMASGLPVVAIRSPGLTETVVPNSTGILTDSADVQFTNAILTLAADADLRQSMGRAARSASRRYDIRRTIDKTLSLYAELVDQRPDLKRKEPHGRWLRRTEAWESRLAEFTQALQINQPRKKESDS